MVSSSWFQGEADNEEESSLTAGAETTSSQESQDEQQQQESSSTIEVGTRNRRKIILHPVFHPFVGDFSCVFRRELLYR